MYRYVHTFLCTCFFFVFLNAQQADDPVIEITPGNIELESLIDLIRSQSPYSFSYNSKYIKQLGSVELEQERYVLSELIDHLEAYFDLKFDPVPGQFKYIIYRDRMFTLSGMVLDSISGEGLPGVLIFNRNSILGTTNQDGFFSIPVDGKSDSISFSYIGYKLRTFDPDSFDPEEHNYVILSNKNLLNEIVIRHVQKEFNHILPEEQIHREDLEKSQSISGTPDVFSYLRMLPGVSVGSEGQNGLIVRGGGPDQNLIMIDGIPVYEASHLGGLNSVFIKDAVKNINFYKSAFPARHDGKLSSVVDVTLKDGHRHKFQRSVSIGLEGLEGHLEGPLSENTSVNLNGKFSWFSFLASPLLENNLEFNNSTFKYYDGYAKLSHWFSPSNRLSVSYYSGNDLIRLSRNNEDSPAFGFTDVNRIEWGNRLLAANWHLALSKQLYFTSNIGVTNYNYSSRGSYTVDFLENDTLKVQSFDILSNSDLQDILFKNSITYFSQNTGKYTLGFNYTRHRNEPSIIESEEFLDPGSIPATELDSTYLSDEYALYVENELFTGNGWKIRSGFRLNYFGGLDKNYIYLLPRISIGYEKKNRSYAFSYSRMNQFIHLLVNPGPGLPSDLWVPSTANIEPEISDVFSASAHWRKNPFLIGVHGFYNIYHNVLEYSNEFDIIYSLILDNQLYNVRVDNSNWENRVSTGTGRSYGAEFFGGLKFDDWECNISYTISRSTRQFAQLNKGESFPYKYDRLHNLSARVQYDLGRNRRLHFNFVYGTGNAFTLATQTILGPDGIERLVPTSRNNFRVPDFHHLDILYTAAKPLSENRKLEYSIGIYNVYNRLNPFYVYLYQDPENPSDSEFRKISIYPILPKLNLKYTW